MEELTLLFNSATFLFYFLPATAVLCVAASRFLGRNTAIGVVVAASFVFYGWSKQSDILLLAISILVNYWIAGRIMADRRRMLLTAGIAFDLGLLFYFKYTGFFFQAIGTAGLSEWSLAEIALPLAISFFTFQQIAYLVDVYQGKTRNLNLLEYAFFVSFFPQLIAGPIVHHSEISGQLSRKRAFRFHPSDVIVGICILFIGVYKKVVFADSMGSYSDALFAQAGDAPSLLEAWAGALAYTFQIYFDFSGYSDMAIGLSRIFGILLPLNFASPYKSRDIISFWRTWHITLSRFLRDYLYYPLGGNRLGIVRRYLNLMIVMTLGGLWHGAAYSFIVWGALHGLYLIVNHAYHRALKAIGRPSPLPGWTARLITFIAVVVGWVFFRADSLDDALGMLCGMAGFNGLMIPAWASALPFQLGATGLSHAEMANVPPVLIGWIGVLLIVTFFAPNTQTLFSIPDPGDTDPGETEPTPLSQTFLAHRLGTAATWITVLAVIAVSVLVIILRGNENNLFIYMYF